MKKNIITAICFVLVSFFAIVVSHASDLKTLYEHKNEFAAAVGTENNGAWSYMTSSVAETGDDGTYIDYDSYSAMLPDGTAWVGVLNSTSYGRVEKDLIKIRVNGRVAIVWTAPMGGSINIAPGNGLGRNHSEFKQYSDSGSAYNLQPIDVNISVVKNDCVSVLYDRSLEPISEHYYGNNPFKADPEISINVDAGDKIFFEAYGTSSNYSELRWDPYIEYSSCAQYYNETTGLTVCDGSGISAGDNLTCTVFDKALFMGECRQWFFLFGGDGRLVCSKITDIQTFDETNRTAVCTVSVPDLADTDNSGTGYDDWHFSTVMTRGEQYYPFAMFDVN